jgi:VWFA-related protein
MRPVATSVVLLAIADDGAGAVVRAAAQQASDSQRSYLARATAVLVDVVVRDRQARPVLDLKADDFEVFEDGIKQKVGSFTLVSRGAGIGIGVRSRVPGQGPTTVVEPTGPSAPEPERSRPSVVALVFDALSAEALNICQKATLEHVAMTGEPESKIAVFETEPSLRLVQRYTSEPALIRSAVTRLTATGEGARELREDKLNALRDRRKQLDVAAFDPSSVSNVTSSAQGQNAALVGQAEVQRLLVQSEMRLLQAFDSLDRDHRGYGTTNALLAILQSMQFFSGRKSVVFFSEGLPASPAMQSQLQSVIEAANRANVSIYAVDAKGLRVLSSTTETRKEVEALGDDRLRQLANPDLSDQPLTRAMERTEDMMRHSGEAGLAHLSEDTGGFLIRDTNDVGSAFHRIDEDLRFHYLLTYSPTNDAIDGKFRTINVKVNRPGVSIFARKGYRAVRNSTAPILSYEAPALLLLDSASLPNAFASQSAAFAFPEPDRPGLAPVVVRVTTDALRFDVDQKDSTYTGQAVIVVRITDASGQVVKQLSQQYVLNGDARDLETARKGEILFYREPELQPGAYRVESLVYDVLAEKGSARVGTVVVPTHDSPKLKMSSLVLVARTEGTSERTKAEGDKAPPFYYGDMLLYPNVGEPLKSGVDRMLSFYFVVYPASGRCACSAQISLLKNGQILADATRPLESAGGSRLQHVAQLPIEKLAAGVYELRVTVNDDQEQQTRTAFFTVT